MTSVSLSVSQKANNLYEIPLYKVLNSHISSASSNFLKSSLSITYLLLFTLYIILALAFSSRLFKNRIVSSEYIILNFAFACLLINTAKI